MQTRETILWIIVTILCAFSAVHTYTIFRTYGIVLDMLALMEKIVEVDEQKDELVDQAVGMVEHLFGEEER